MIRLGAVGAITSTVGMPIVELNGCAMDHAL